ncbi:MULTISPECIES: DUF3515 domain-containing protein [Isoptericola]|uniref:DUF3515 domain-containing protein n=1 Tax=Isoptericola haloaureus TaxID=1542902 RepID=A0ABU7ZBK5_9MICO|nr:DUF3515 domain-containing protein [Isoptericola sp. AK164]
MLVRRLAVLLSLPCLALLAACTPTIGVEAAPDADDPDCAPVMLALPDVVAGDLERAKVNAQATAAWGEPGAAVTLRCGVEQPGPSPDCQRIETANGSVDWIVESNDTGTWRFTTYGRSPAIEVTVPPAVTTDHSTSFIADLTGAIGQVPQTRQCT